MSLPSSPAGSDPAAASHGGETARRLWLILVRPAHAFRGLERERLTWLLPALLVALITILPSQTLLRSLHIERQLELLGGYVVQGLLTPESAHEMSQNLPDPQETPSLPALLLPLLGGTLAQLTLRFLLPAILFLGGARFLFEVRVRLTTMLGIIGFASIPAALRELLRTPLALAQGSLEISFSPAAFVAGDSIGRYALGLLDFFDLWILGLLIYGLTRLTGLSTARASLLVLPLWALQALMKLGLRASPFGAGL